MPLKTVLLTHRRFYIYVQNVVAQVQYMTSFNIEPQMWMGTKTQCNFIYMQNEIHTYVYACVTIINF